MSWSAKGIANLLLDLAEQDRRTIDPLAMQKLVYFAEGWNLALFNESLVAEQFEAWRRGPFVPVLYYSLKAFGASPIWGRLMRFDFELERPVEEDRPTKQEPRDLVREVWRVYQRYTAGQLVALTHERGSPWEVTRRHFQSAPDARIDKTLIQDWFISQADRSQGRNLL